MNKFEELKIKDIVAFKNNINNEWYTGEIVQLLEPLSKYNNSQDWYIRIEVILPINPQWFEKDDKTIYTFHEISQIIKLEDEKR